MVHQSVCKRVFLDNADFIKIAAPILKENQIIHHVYAGCQ